MIGEIAVYGGGRRTATVIADIPIIAYVLLASATVAQMGREARSLAIAFHRMMVRIEAERLRVTSHELENATALSPGRDPPNYFAESDSSGAAPRQGCSVISKVTLSGP
jgi:hypothetical protein